MVVKKDVLAAPEQIGNIIFGRPNWFTMKMILTSFLLSLSIYALAQDSLIQKKDLISSAKLFDLRFTSKEIDT